MKNCSGSVGKIESFSTVDGPGIRSVVFLTGCNLRCIYCHNPEFLSRTENNITSDELAKKLLKNKVYFKNGGGITFSGGEPLIQSDFIIEVAKLLKKEGIHIALDTAGVANYNLEIFKYMDLVLLDIKGSNKELYQNITGFDHLSDTLGFLDSCLEYKIPVIVRYVIVPGVNDTKEDILELKKLLDSYSKGLKIELLPYHNMAIDKYQKIHKDYALKDLPSLSYEKLKELERYL